MLVCELYISVGGDPNNRQHIGTMTLANVNGEASAIADYHGTLEHPSGRIEIVSVQGHIRRRGAWELVRKVLNKYV